MIAMLVLPDVFERTWGQRAPLFWPTATWRVGERAPNFLFMAEFYWDMEWTLQQQGFDYSYDKRRYYRLREGHAQSGKKRKLQDQLSSASYEWNGEDLAERGLYLDLAFLPYLPSPGTRLYSG